MTIVEKQEHNNDIEEEKEEKREKGKLSKKRKMKKRGEWKYTAKEIER